MARRTAAEVPPTDVAMVARRAVARKRNAGFKNALAGCSDVGLQAEGSLIAILGAPGGTRSAHIVKFRPVGVEGASEELAPERLDAGRAVPSIPAQGRGGEGGCTHRSHDAGPCFRMRLLPLGCAFVRRKPAFA